MFFIKRSLLYVKRKKSKVLTVGSILFIVSTLVLTGLVIKSASQNAFEYARKTLGASVSYRTDMSSIMGERGSRTPGSGAGFNLPTDFSNITLDEIKEIEENADLIKSTVINATLAANASDFSYYSVSENTEETSGMMRRGASINIVGSNYEKSDNVFFNENNTLISGRYFTDEEISSASSVVIIEKTIATLNDLEVGDSITVTKMMMGESESESVTLEIVGIYKTNNPTDISGEDFRGSFNLTENTMYAPFNFILNNNNNRIDSVTFNLNNPSDVESFVSYVSAFETKYRSVSANDEAYQKMVGPIESVSNTSNILVFVVIVSGGLIIGLLSMLSIKDRKYELGVLLSLGEARFKIMLQLVFEMIIISIASFSLAILTSNYTAQLTTNFLLNNALSENTEEDDVRGFGNFRNPNANIDVEVIDTLEVNVSAVDSAKMLGLGLVIIIVGNISQALFVLKANPKEILLER